MGAAQIANFLGIQGIRPFDRDKARQEVVEYLKDHMEQVAMDIEKKGEAIIPTPSGSFVLTKDDLSAL